MSTRVVSAGAVYSGGMDLPDLRERTNIDRFDVFRKLPGACKADSECDDSIFGLNTLAVAPVVGCTVAMVRFTRDGTSAGGILTHTLPGNDSLSAALTSDTIDRRKAALEGAHPDVVILYHRGRAAEAEKSGDADGASGRLEERLKTDYGRLLPGANIAFKPYDEGRLAHTVIFHIRDGFWESMTGKGAFRGGELK